MRAGGDGADSRELAGRVAIVTGGSRGLGRAIACVLADAGAMVAVLARSEAVWDDRLPGTVHETVREIQALGGTAIPVPADLADLDGLDGVVDSVRERLGPIDILVNNAALTVGGRPGSPQAVARRGPTVRYGDAPSFIDFPLKAYRLHVTIDAFAPYRLMQLVLPDMVRAQRGVIVNVSSAAALLPGEGPYGGEGKPHLFAYGSAKAALHVLTQSVAREFEPYGIRANVLIPSLPIATPGTLALLQGQSVSQWASEEDFGEATKRLVARRPIDPTGQILFHDDVLNPQLGRRGFLSAEM